MEPLVCGWEYLVETRFLHSTDFYGVQLADAKLFGANPDAAMYNPAGRIKVDPLHVFRLCEAAESRNIGEWNEWVVYG
ncbi:MAG TPA: hypothetical protein O0W81_01875 [Methanocorpusculum sp.]|nr:hypothetical protein [Methanocorpusculum sp.]